MRILIVEPNWLGDVIFTTPAFKAVKEQLPGSVLGVITARRCTAILKNNPYIDKIYQLNEKKEEKSLKAKISFIKEIRAGNFDMAILLHRSFTKTLLIFLAGIKQRIGYNYKKRSALLTQKIPPADKDSAHKQNYYLNVFKGAGIRIADKNCRIYITEAEGKKAQSLIAKLNIKQPYRLIGINPFSNWPPKDWPLSCYKELIQKMLEKQPNLYFLLTSKLKHKESENIFSDLRPNFIDLSGKTSLRELVALYSKLDLMISGDSGPLHLAAALGARYIGLYGATSPGCTGPISSTPGRIIFENNTCPVPCYIKKCKKSYQCMNRIDPEKVCRTALELLEAN